MNIQLTNTSRQPLGIIVQGQGVVQLPPGAAAIYDSTLLDSSQLQSLASRGVLSYHSALLPGNTVVNQATLDALRYEVEQTIANNVLLSGSYADPAWLTSLATSKLTGQLDAGRISGAPAGVLKGSVGGALAAAVAGTDYPGLATPNTFTQLQTLPVRDKGGQVYNVLAYGATGGGTVEDTAALQAALDAAGAVQGTVYLPAGTYLCGPLTVPAGVRLSGTVRSGVIIKLRAGVVNPSTATALLTLGADCTLERLTLDGNLAANPAPAQFPTALVSVPASGVRITRCTLRNCTYYGVYAYAATDLTLDRCTFTGCGASALYAAQSCHRLRVEDNWLYGLNSTGIQVHSSDGQHANLLSSAENPVIRGNVIDYRGQTMADSNSLAIELFHPANNQTLTITATGGTYTLQVDPSGAVTAALAYNASAATIEAALNAAGIVAQVAATGSAYTLTVAGEFLLVNTGGLTGGTATITATVPPTGVFGGTVLGNQIWGPTGGPNTIFGISLGGCTSVKCVGNTIAGPGINIAVETANATRPVVVGNTIDGAVLGWSASGTTYHPTFADNKLRDCTSYGAQLYGNASGQNQGSVVQAQILGNTWTDCGTNNAQFCTILFNGTGRGSTVSTNQFVLKDSPNPIRAVQIFSANIFLTEYIIIANNLCSCDPTGTAAHGIGLLQVQGARYALIVNNTVNGAIPLGGNGDIDGIDLVDSFGAGHLIQGNQIHSLNNHFYDISASGVEPNRFVANSSYFPTAAHYTFTATDHAHGNLADGVPVADQNLTPARRQAVNGATTLTAIALRLVAVTAIAAPFTITLPAANAVPAGDPLEFKDESGTASTHAVTISPAGTDTAESALALASDGAHLRIYSDGVSKWFLL